MMSYFFGDTHALVAETHHRVQLIFYMTLTLILCTCVMLLIHIRAVLSLQECVIVRGKLVEVPTKRDRE
tara:strand:+ start:543 stop:749 length:207 start_codon:yes stop_codon:yes gene_type:complete